MVNVRNPAAPNFLNQAVSAEKSGVANFNSAQGFTIGVKPNAAIAHNKLPAASDNHDLGVDAAVVNEADPASENPAAGDQNATTAAVEESKNEAAAAEGSNHGTTTNAASEAV